MLYQLKEINGRLYLQVNKSGTLEKLPRLHWWDELKLHVESHFKGGVSVAKVKRILNKYRG